MDLKPLPFHAPLDQYQKQAQALLAAHVSGDPQAIELFHRRHPRFLDSKIPWLPKNLPDSEIQSAVLDFTDAQLVIARWYDFQSWPALAEYVEAITREGSPVFLFESAVE